MKNFPGAGGPGARTAKILFFTNAFPGPGARTAKILFFTHAFLQPRGLWPNLHFENPLGGGGVQLVLNLQMAVVSVNTYSSVFLTFLQKAMRSVKKGRPRPQGLEFTERYAICKKGFPRTRRPHTRRAVSQNLQLEVQTRPRVRQNLQIQHRCLARRGEFKQVSDVKSRCSKCETSEIYTSSPSLDPSVGCQ